MRQLVFFFCFFLSSLSALPVEAQAGKELPKTIEQAVGILIDRMSEKDRVAIRQTKEEDLIRYHFGWGTGIRNEFGLWGGNKDLLISACGGVACHPDSASMKIIKAAWKKLNEMHEEDKAQNDSNK